MNRVVLFAHFDEHAIVRGHVVNLVRALSACGTRLLFVSTAPLASAELDKVRPFCSDVWLRPNVGLDFGSWRFALERLELADIDELILANSSVSGPVYPLLPILEQMSGAPCDFWGMTESHEHRWHLQSYFLVFKRRILHSPEFAAFWRGVLPYRNKEQIIQSYEVGLSTFFAESGFVGRPFAPADALTCAPARLLLRLVRRHNPTLYQPNALLERGMPFVKISLLRNNVGNVSLRKVNAALVESGHGVDIDASTPPTIP